MVRFTSFAFSFFALASVTEGHFTLLDRFIWDVWQFEWWPCPLAFPLSWSSHMLVGVRSRGPPCTSHLASPGILHLHIVA